MASESVSFARAILPYNRIIAFTEIYIPREWDTWRNPKGANDSKITGEVAKWNAADSTVKSVSGITLYSRYGSGITGTANMYRMRRLSMCQNL
jgi:hypothetical protein